MIDDRVTQKQPVTYIDLQLAGGPDGAFYIVKVFIEHNKDIIRAPDITKYMLNGYNIIPYFKNMVDALMYLIKSSDGVGGNRLGFDQWDIHEMIDHILQVMLLVVEYKDDHTISWYMKQSIMRYGYRCFTFMYEYDSETEEVMHIEFLLSANNFLKTVPRLVGVDIDLAIDDLSASDELEDITQALWGPFGISSKDVDI